MTKLKFLIFAVVTFFVVSFAFGFLADKLDVPDNDRVTWVLRILAATISAASVGFTIFARNAKAKLLVTLILSLAFYPLLLFVALFPIWLAWNEHGFVGAAVAFFLPGLAQIWASWEQISRGTLFYPIVCLATPLFYWSIQWWKSGD
jgi:hypothetical protein